MDFKTKTCFLVLPVPLLLAISFGCLRTAHECHEEAPLSGVICLAGWADNPVATAELDVAWPVGDVATAEASEPVDRVHSHVQPAGLEREQPSPGQGVVKTSTGHAASARAEMRDSEPLASRVQLQRLPVVDHEATEAGGITTATTTRGQQAGTPEATPPPYYRTASRPGRPPIVKSIPPPSAREHAPSNPTAAEPPVVGRTQVEPEKVKKVDATIDNPATIRGAASANTFPLFPLASNGDDQPALEGWLELARGPIPAPSPPEVTVPAATLASLTVPPQMARQAESIIRQAASLAQRGAFYSARDEYIRALRLVAQSLDAELGQTYHTRALARGLVALDEADDFATTSTTLETDLQVAGFVAGHRTPALKDVDTSAMTPLVAIQAYYEYALPQLVRAGNREPVASAALCGLGRVSMRSASRSGRSGSQGPTAIALFQAALTIDNQNADAANELGVLLARYGQLEQAESYLQQSVAIKPSHASLTNLTEVRGRLGRAVELRSHVQPPVARQSPPVAKPSPPLAMQSNKPSSSVDSNSIVWVTPEAFVRMGNEQRTANASPYPTQMVAGGGQTTARLGSAASSNRMWDTYGENSAGDQQRINTLSGWQFPETQHTKNRSGFSNWFFR